MNALVVSRRGLVFGLVGVAVFLAVALQTVEGARAAPSLAFSDCAGQAFIPEVECNALVALYNSTAGASWTDDTGWLVADDPCTWYGVICDTGQVISLNLFTNNLVGTIPAQLGDLSSLQYLNLANNQLSGSIPVELGDAVSLDSLFLSYNQLSGAIPVELGGLTNLVSLYLSNNQLSGSIPVQLGNLSSLESLLLNTNQLSGTIPAELGNLISLQFLYLSGNQLSGSIPAELGDLTNLQVLYLYINQLSGSIPAELGNMTNLQILRLQTNQLSGSIPVQLGNLANLQNLHLGDNQLGGSIPVDLGNLTNLDKLYLYSNQLSGGIPTELSNLVNLTSIDLSINQLSGNIPVELGNLTNLQDLGLSSNQLSGSIPVELGTLAALQTLGLSANQLSGNIPVQLGNLGNLEDLYLTTNQLSGSIPAELGNLNNLQHLYLNNNQLSGSIPTELGNLIGLTRLYLSDNTNLTGPLPVSLTNLTVLDYFSYYNTDLCEPQDAAFQAWLTAITYLGGTGVACADPVEVLQNNSYEYYLPTRWPWSQGLAAGEGPDCGGGNAHTGNCAWSYIGDGSTKEIRFPYRYIGSAGDSYTVSIWRKGLNIPAGGAAFLRMVFINADSTKTIFAVPVTSGDYGVWEQFSNTFVAPKDYIRINVSLMSTKPSGTLWWDDISIVRGGAEQFPNTSFEYYLPTKWVWSQGLATGEGPDCGSSNAHSGSCAWHYIGDGSTKEIRLPYRYVGVAGDSYTASIWRKGLNVPAGGAAFLRLVFINADSTKTIFTVPVTSGDYAQWEQFSNTFVAPKDYTRINVSLMFTKPSGTLWWDDISVVRGP